LRRRFRYLDDRTPIVAIARIGRPHDRFRGCSNTASIGHNYAARTHPMRLRNEPYGPQPDQIDWAVAAFGEIATPQSS
jgi:hypothetical protein